MDEGQKGMEDLHCVAHESSKPGLVPTKGATLMDLRTPYCAAAGQSPLTDLTPSPANLSISQTRQAPWMYHFPIILPQLTTFRN